MQEIFRDPVWQFAGVIIAVLAALLSTGLFLLGRRRKEFVYTVAVDESLITVAEEVSDDLQIIFDGHQVRDLRLLILELTNTGNSPILPSEYVKYPTLVFNGEAVILSVEIAETKPKEIEVAIKQADREVSFQLGLMNSKDRLRAKMLVSNYSGFEVSGRIAGISEIKQKEKRAELVPYYYLSMLFAFVTAVVSFFVRNTPIRISLLIFSIMVATGLIMVLLFNVAKYEKRVRQ